MERIVRHIETLLRRHDYVIVPDLGGFVLQNQSAVILPEQINPPLTTVGFNPLMSMSDGLLTLEISRAENISYREAVQWIDTEIEAAKVLLNSHKKVELGNLGFLSMGADNKILFVPSEKMISLPSNYGLNAVHYSPATAEIAIEGAEKQRFTITLPSPRRLIRYGAAGMLALGLLFFAPQINTISDYANFNPVKILKFTHPDVQKPETVENLVSSMPEKQEKQVETPIVETHYHVIVASVRLMKTAEKYLAELKSQNYTQAHVLPPSKLYRVAIESFTTKDEALAHMEQLRKTSSQFADAWVLFE